MFLENYSKIREIIKPFTQERFWIFSSMDTTQEVVGMFLCASSTVRKQFSMDRINKIIEENKLPLEVEEKNLHMTNSFTIKLKR